MGSTRFTFRLPLDAWEAVDPGSLTGKQVPFSWDGGRTWGLIEKTEPGERGCLITMLVSDEGDALPALQLAADLPESASSTPAAPAG